MLSMDEETQKDIAYALLAHTAIQYSSAGADTLFEGYRFFANKGHSPIAAAILSTRSITYGNQSNETLEGFCEKFRSLDKF